MRNGQYIVMASPVSIPGGRRSYTGTRVAVLEMEPGFSGRPAAISERAPGVRRIVRDFGMCRDTQAAEALVARLAAQ